MMRFRSAGPAQNTRYTVATIKQIRLMAPIDGVRIMSLGNQLINSRCRTTSIVGGKNDNCIIVLTRLFHCLQNTSNHRIDHQHKIGIIPQAGFTLKLFYRKNWRMGSRKRQIKEIRLIGRGFLLHIIAGTVNQIR